MIKRLTRRMILLVLCGLLLASAGLVFVINYMNWRNLARQASSVLDMLAESGGQRPTFPDFWPENGEFPAMPGGPNASFPGEDISQGGQTRKGWEDDSRQEEEDAGTDRPDIDSPPQEWPGFRNRSLSQMNAAILANFYTVELDAQGQVTSWTSDRADIYTDEQVKALAAEALARGTAEGRVDTQFYRLIESDREKQLIVVDERLEVQNARDVMRLTLLVALAECALLSLGAVWLIRRMVKPVDTAMEKQKQFVWDASHELKTPLSVISANAELLSSEVGEMKPLTYIQSEVRRTDQLVQNLLTLARMEKGAADVAMQAFDLSRALLEVALPFESTVFEAGKSIGMRIPAGIRYTGNEEMIKQLAVILLSNAQKYSDPGGSIRMTLEEKGDRRILRVQNSGPVIPPDAQEKIFDRFYRVDSSHNREVEGNGLGLAIARSIVEMHRGRIAVRSTEKEGTTFTVTL